MARLRGLGFIVWQARHYMYHLLVGLAWAWFLRETWQEFNPRWITISLIGSVIPDFDHVIYFMTYGKHDLYTKQVRSFLRAHEWRTLTAFVATGHKYNTSLATHNYYFTAFLSFTAFVSFLFDWKAGVIFFGAMVFHYLLDIWDDIAMLGKINSNWRRFWKPRNS